jgi:hypothetical protein
MEWAQNCHKRPSSTKWAARCCAQESPRIRHDLFFFLFLRSAALFRHEHIIGAVVDPIGVVEDTRFG